MGVNGDDFVIHQLRSLAGQFKAGIKVVVPEIVTFVFVLVLPI